MNGTIFPSSRHDIFDLADNPIWLDYGHEEFIKQKRDLPPENPISDGCSLGVALVFDYGQNPTIQIVAGQPLVTPTSGVIFAQLYEFTLDTPDAATLVPFEYDSAADPGWEALQMNSGEEIRLLTTLQCGINNVYVSFSGTFNEQL